VEGVPPLIALITLGAFGRHRLSAHRWLSSVQVLPAVTNDFLFQMASSLSFSNIPFPFVF